MLLAKYKAALRLGVKLKAAEGGTMKLLRNIWDWVEGQVVGDVPEGDAVCVFDCRKPQCTEGEWEQCTRRLRHAAGELMPSEEPPGAANLVDVLVNESPASASFPVGAVLMSGDGVSDQAFECPEVSVLDGWMYDLVCSEQTAKQTSRS